METAAFRDNCGTGKSTVICRNELNENQRRLLMENEELKRQLDAMKEEMEILEIEQQAARERQIKEENQKKAMKEECRDDELLEKDRAYSSTLLAEIWKSGGDASD